MSEHVVLFVYSECFLFTLGCFRWNPRWRRWNFAPERLRGEKLWGDLLDSGWTCGSDDTNCDLTPAELGLWPLHQWALCGGSGGNGQQGERREVFYVFFCVKNLLFSHFNLPTEIQQVWGGAVDDGVCDRGHGGSGRYPLNILLYFIRSTGHI